MSGPSLADDLAFFREATVNICGSLDLKTALNSCRTFLSRTMPVFGISIHQYDKDLNAFEVLAIASPRGAKEVELIFKLPPELKDFAEWREASNLKVVGGPDDDPVAKRLIEIAFPYFQDRNLSVLALRLDVTDTRRVADVCLFAKGIDQYEASHARLIGMLNEPFAIAIANFLTHRELRVAQERLVCDNRYLRKEMIQLTGYELIGVSSGLRQVIEMVRHVAPMDTPVLLTGETGVGKEVVANAIQQNSSRKEGPFIKINCGAIPESLLDSELFGHEKGAFTGATQRRQGRFELANGGTIFLDEIGEMPPSVQIRLLRVLQDGTFERVGGIQPITVNIRVIAATHRDIPHLITTDRFRQDLYFRLNVFPIQIPPLRERREDIPTLARYFLERKCRQMNRLPVTTLAEGAMDQLVNYDWPGNVRELENIVERSLILHQAGPLSIYPIGENRRKVPNTPISSSSSQILSLDATIAAHIKTALRASGGKVQGPGGAAEILQINPNTLRKRMIKLGVPFGRKAKLY